jgi:hypothetical protein
MSQAQFALGMTVPTLAVLVGILVNNSRLSDLRALMESRSADTNNRIADLRALMDARFDAARQELLRVEQVLDARLSHLEQNRR